MALDPSALAPRSPACRGSAAKGSQAMQTQSASGDELAELALDDEPLLHSRQRVVEAARQASPRLVGQLSRSLDSSLFHSGSPC
eukprot:2140613-Heterocapsa_arctica.AAC.1